MYPAVFKNLKLMINYKEELKMKRLLSAVALSACCSAASAATYDITAVLSGSDNGFGFSSLHFAGEDPASSNPADNDGDPSTGTILATFDTTPVSGTYDDITGNLNMVLGLTDGGTVTFAGTGFLFDANSPNTLSNVSTLSVIFSNPAELLSDTDIIFDNTILDCCANANPAPNSFDGTLMSLWGADFPPGTINGVVAGGPRIGLDLRIEVSAVPVPAAVWLFGSGLLGLAGIARRRKAS